MKNPDELANELFDFVVAGAPKVPEDIAASLTDTVRPGNHAHVAVAMAAELIYAHKDELQEAGAVEALDLGAELAESAGLYGLAGLQQDARGVRIAKAIRKMPGTKTPEAAPTADPDIAERFVEKPVEAEAELASDGKGKADA